MNMPNSGKRKISEEKSLLSKQTSSAKMDSTGVLPHGNAISTNNDTQISSGASRKGTSNTRIRYVSELSSDAQNQSNISTFDASTLENHQQWKPEIPEKVDYDSIQRPSCDVDDRPRIPLLNATGRHSANSWRRKQNDGGPIGQIDDLTEPIMSNTLSSTRQGQFDDADESEPLESAKSSPLAFYDNGHDGRIDCTLDMAFKNLSKKQQNKNEVERVLAKAFGNFSRTDLKPPKESGDLSKEIIKLTESTSVRPSEMPTNPNDIAFGIGSSQDFLKNRGYLIFMGLIDGFFDEYDIVRPEMKPQVCEKVLERMKTVRVRFVQWDSTKGSWEDLGRQESIAKVLQKFYDISADKATQHHSAASLSISNQTASDTTSNGTSYNEAATTEDTGLGALADLCSRLSAPTSTQKKALVNCTSHSELHVNELGNVAPSPLPTSSTQQGPINEFPVSSKPGPSTTTAPYLVSDTKQGQSVTTASHLLSASAAAKNRFSPQSRPSTTMGQHGVTSLTPVQFTRHMQSQAHTASKTLTTSQNSFEARLRAQIDSRGTWIPGQPEERFRLHQVEVWTHRLNEVKEFVRTHGHCIIPHDYPPNQVLARWVKRQRCQYQIWHQNPNKSTMTGERAKVLERLGFCWQHKSTVWALRYQDLEEFVKKHGHSLVPSGFPENTKLATWVKSQRRHMKLMQQGEEQHSMTPERIKLLNKLNFAWSFNVTKKRKNHEKTPDERKPGLSNGSELTTLIVPRLIAPKPNGTSPAETSVKRPRLSASPTQRTAIQNTKPTGMAPSAAEADVSQEKPPYTPKANVTPAEKSVLQHQKLLMSAWQQAGSNPDHLLK